MIVKRNGEGARNDKKKKKKRRISGEMPEFDYQKQYFLPEQSAHASTVSIITHICTTRTSRSDK